MKLCRISRNQVLFFSVYAVFFLNSSVKSNEIINESNFSPLMGQPVTRKMPLPGNYSSSFHFSIAKLLNRESSFSQSISGAAILNLSKENTVNACFAVHSIIKNSQSKYITKDGKHNYYIQDERFLMGVAGHWSEKNNDSIRINLTSSWRNDCTNRNNNKEHEIHLNLYCITLLKNDRLPENILACRFKPKHYILDLIAFIPKDTPRAGPFAFQNLAMKRKLYDKRERWLLLGSELGLRINSKESRRSNKATFKFSQSPVVLHEKDYLEHQN